MIRHARREGVRKLVLTPCIHAGHWDNSLGFLLPRFDAFRNLVTAKGMDVELYLGAEVRLSPETIRLLTQGQIPFIGGWEGMKVMLMSLPDDRIPPNAFSAVRYLVNHGVLPMIAHPECNREVIGDARVLQPFMDEGCLLQLNAASVAGNLGPVVQQSAHRLLKKGWVTVVASEARDLRHRLSRMKSAYQRIFKHYGEDTAERLTLLGPGRLLAERASLRMDAMARLEALRLS